MSSRSRNPSDDRTDRDRILMLTSDDVKYTTQVNRWFLKPIGLWPLLPNARKAEKILIDSQICFCYALICFFVVPCVLHTFLVETDTATQVKLVGPIGFCSMAFTKFTFLVFHRNHLCDCIEHIAIDWSKFRSSGEREIMLKDAKFGRFLAILCACFMYGGGFFYVTILPLTSGNTVTADNLTLRPLTVPVYAPLFEARTSPSYELVFATQWFSGFIMYTITIGVCSIAAVFASHICGQFKILVHRLRQLVDGSSDRKSDDVIDRKMADIVELHLRALALANKLENILSEVAFIEALGCTTTICFVGYYMITDWEQSDTIGIVTYFVLLVSFTFNIFIFCYIGETLNGQSKDVGTMTYMIDWYKLPGTHARALILVIIMAKYPATITAGKMAELSLRNFLNVLKTAFTYLNLLRTMMT